MRHVPAPTQALVYGGSPLLGQPGGEGARIRLSADETRRHPPIAALQVLPRSLQAAGVMHHVLNCTTVAHPKLVVALYCDVGGQYRTRADACDYPGAKVPSHADDKPTVLMLALG